MSQGGAEDRREIMASVEAIGRIGERWSDHIRRRERRLVVAKAFLYGGLVFFALVSAVVAYVASEYDFTYFVSHRDSFVPYFEVSILLGVATLAASYLVLRRRAESKFGELSQIMDQLKEGEGGHGEAWRALAATRKMLDVLPEIARPRSQDALVYGLLAFALSAIVARAVIGIAVGLVIFLYFRYEGRRTYETELSRLEAQKKIFEERMQSFASTL